MAAPREHIVIDPQGGTYDVPTQAGIVTVRNGLGWTWSRDAAQEAAERTFQGIHVEREEPYPSTYGKTLIVLSGCRACREHVCTLRSHQGDT